jgi:hypothetical protein
VVLSSTSRPHADLQDLDLSRWLQQSQREADSAAVLPAAVFLGAIEPSPGGPDAELRPPRETRCCGMLHTEFVTVLVPSSRHATICLFVSLAATIAATSRCRGVSSSGPGGRIAIS